MALPGSWALWARAGRVVVLDACATLGGLRAIILI